ncbi:MAG: hypothetical protein HN868_06785 [Gammaproteobacteria bacterium]|nr:hypothetical protein [Gammaproteobacteria bacterium]
MIGLIRRESWYTSLINGDTITKNKNNNWRAIMSRRKLERNLTEAQRYDVWDYNHRAEKSMEEIYHTLRERYGARHKLTLRAEQSVKSLNKFKYKLRQALGEYGDESYANH